MYDEIIEERILIDGDLKIGATISYKDKTKKVPAIVIIMGTGKTDRDGNTKGFKTNFYKNLSQELTNLGFVTVRYDKRGTFESEGTFNKTGLMDLVTDATRVIRYMKKLPYVDENNIIVCGHSEGAMIATLLTEIEETSRLLLLGGAGMCMKDALYYQNKLVEEEFKNKKGILGFLVRKQVSNGKATAKVDKMFDKCAKSKNDTVFFGGTILNAKWIKEHGIYNSEHFVNLLKKYCGKVLAITGKSDLSADFERLSELEGIENITTYTPDNVNHILREVDDNNSMLTVQKQYKRLSHNPIQKETIRKIEEWLR